MTPFGGRFRGGPATLKLSLFACDDFCQQVELSERVILRGGA